MASSTTYTARGATASRRCDSRPIDRGGDGEDGDRGHHHQHDHHHVHGRRGYPGRERGRPRGRPQNSPRSAIVRRPRPQMPMRWASSSRWYGRIAEEQLARLGPLEVQVRGVLPREADAAVDLDVLGGGVEVGLRAVGLGQPGHRGQLVVHLRGAPHAVVGGRLGRLDLEQHVGALVLDGLERADGPAELHAHLGVLDGHLEHPLGPADLLGRQGHGGQVEHRRQRRPSPSPRCRAGGPGCRRTRAWPACGSGPWSTAPCG